MDRFALSSHILGMEAMVSQRIDTPWDAKSKEGDNKEDPSSLLGERAQPLFESGQLQTGLSSRSLVSSEEIYHVWV